MRKSEPTAIASDSSILSSVRVVNSGNASSSRKLLSQPTWQSQGFGFTQCKACASYRKGWFSLVRQRQSALPKSLATVARRSSRKR